MKLSKQLRGWDNDIADDVAQLEAENEAIKLCNSALAGENAIVESKNAALKQENEAYQRLDEEDYASLAVQLVELKNKKDDAYGEVHYLSIQQRRLRKDIAALKRENEALENRKFVYVSESGLWRVICMISDEPWMCYKHADGQWVTLRKIALLEEQEDEQTIE